MDNNQETNYSNTFVVTTINDENDGINKGMGVSLREAVAAANNSAVADRILFDESLSDGNIVLKSGEIKITDSVAIDGMDRNITIDGDNTSRIFNVDDRNSKNELPVSIANLTITNGKTGGDGGAILNEEDLVITHSTITGSTARSMGGGIDNKGSLKIENSTITGNTAKSDGGGINNWGRFEIENSTVSNNEAPDGGGIANLAEIAIISNSTISGNTSSDFGAGIATLGGDRVEVKNSTITDNYAYSGPGSGISQVGAEIFIVTGSIVAGNRDYFSNFSNFSNFEDFGDLDVFNGEFISGGNNLIGKKGNAEAFVSGVNGDIVGDARNPIEPKLGALEDNGGATQTHALLEDSPAINAGSNPDNLSFDQRGEGFHRAIGAVDIGAFEDQYQDQDIQGTDSADVLLGASGDDTIAGLDGNDTIRGEAGNDSLVGDAGRDLLDGGKGNDLLDGGDDRDKLLGEAGDDTLSGENQDDTLLGGVGTDSLDGGSGRDIILGGAGSDTLFGKAGNDLLLGDADSDLFVLESSMGKDFILDFQDKTDFFALGSSLEFTDLNIIDFAGGVMIEDTTNNNLAISFITSIDAADITAEDFTTL